ncbi:MAG: hypothetical protein ACKOB6_06640 [Candidatus Kapaibacterium sp.]
MRESIEMTRREIGADGVILSSEQVLLDGIPMTELVAGIHPEDLARFHTAKRSDESGIPSDILYAAGGSPDDRKRPRIAYAPDVKPVPRVASPSTGQHLPSEIDVHRRLDELHTAIRDLTATQKFRFTSALPESYRLMYEELRSAGFTEDQAMFYIGNMCTRGVSGSLDELRATCKTLIERSMRTISPLQLGAGRSVVVVVGAPGSGKTTFASLLCRSLHLTLQCASTVYRPSDVAVQDTESAGVRHASYVTVKDLTERLTSDADNDFSVIELPLMPQDDTSRECWETIMDVVRPDCVFVTVPSGSHSKRMKAWLDFAEAMENCSIVLTGTDIDGLPGEHVYTMAERNIPVSYLTSGAASPLDISAATGTTVAATVFSGR